MRGLLSRAAAGAVAGGLLFGAPAKAFPPYRSTDADTADPYALELRVGLVKVQREGTETEVAAPLARLNFGLPRKVELISEFEYRSEDREFRDAALGGKWIPLFSESFSMGVEALALLPVRPGDDVTGVEAQLVATFWSERARTHVNAGGFHDPRGSADEDGWRASVLTEFPRDSWRPGVELAAKQVDGEDADVRAGLGAIFDVGRFDVRAGAHAGLTEAAPDFVVSLWVSTKVTLQ
jgi:hypothetical protein